MADEKKSEDKAPLRIDIAPQDAPLRARVAAIEKRWGKRFEEVLVDIHDHIYGKTPEPAAADETKSF